MPNPAITNPAGQKNLEGIVQEKSDAIETLTEIQPPQEAMQSPENTTTIAQNKTSISNETFSIAPEETTEPTITPVTPQQVVDETNTSISSIAIDTEDKDTNTADHTESVFRKNVKEAHETITAL